MQRGRVQGEQEREKKEGEEKVEASTLWDMRISFDEGEKKSNEMMISFAQRGVQGSKNAVRTPNRVFACILG